MQCQPDMRTWEIDGLHIEILLSYGLWRPLISSPLLFANGVYQLVCHAANLKEGVVSQDTANVHLMLRNFTCCCVLVQPWSAPSWHVPSTCRAYCQLLSWSKEHVSALDLDRPQSEFYDVLFSATQSRGPCALHFALLIQKYDTGSKSHSETSN